MFSKGLPQSGCTSPFSKVSQTLQDPKACLLSEISEVVFLLKLS